VKINKELYENISKLTGVDYEPLQYKNPDVEYLLIPEENIGEMLEDLLAEYHRKEEQLEDLKEDLENNYEPKKIDPYEEYGLSRNDFI
jgi:hypothetical protein